jgi:hypothetical protein
MKTKHSWIELIGFCVATTLAAALFFAVVLTSASVAFAGRDTATLGENEAPQTAEGETSQQKMVPIAPATSDEQNFSGLITDELCGPRHNMGSGKSAAECANMCARNGAKYALVDGDGTFTLDGNGDDLAKLAGQRAQVTGVQTGHSIRMISIAAQ